MVKKEDGGRNQTTVWKTQPIHSVQMRCTCNRATWVPNLSSSQIEILFTLMASTDRHLVTFILSNDSHFWLFTSFAMPTEDIISKHNDDLKKMDRANMLDVTVFLSALVVCRRRNSFWKSQIDYPVR